MQKCGRFAQQFWKDKIVEKSYPVTSLTVNRGIHKMGL